MKRYERILDSIFPSHTKTRAIHDLIVRRLKRVTNNGKISDENKPITKDSCERDPYDFWIQENEPDEAHLKTMQIESNSWPYRPKVSIITPAFNPDKYDLEQCIESVLYQVYENWELCVVDGGSCKEGG